MKIRRENTHQKRKFTRKKKENRIKKIKGSLEKKTDYRKRKARMKSYVKKEGNNQKKNGIDV